MFPHKKGVYCKKNFFRYGRIIATYILCVIFMYNFITRIHVFVYVYMNGCNRLKIKMNILFFHYK